MEWFSFVMGILGGFSLGNAFMATAWNKISGTGPWGTVVNMYVLGIISILIGALVK